MDIWLKNEAFRFVVLGLVVLISTILSTKSKLTKILTYGGAPLLHIYVVTLIVSILFGVVQYVTFERVIGVYILFCAIPFTHGLIEGCIEEIFND